jgi:hypothetical protein
MSLKKALAILFLIVAPFSGPKVAAQNPFITNYTSYDGLPSNTVYQVYQDSKKFIWLATDAGVARYDGSDFTYYTKHDGLNSNDVVRIKEDSSGRIWFFNMDATLNFYLDGLIYNSARAPFLDSLTTRELFRNFYEDSDRTIYFYFNHQREIYALDTLNRVRKYRFPSMMMYVPGSGRIIDGLDIRHLQRASDGKLYMWTIAGLYRFDSFPGNYVLIPDSIYYKVVFAEKSTGRYIVKSGSGNFKYDILKMKDDITVNRSIPPIGVNSEFVSSVFEDDKGFVWVSTFDQGVSCYLGKDLVQHFNIIDAQSVTQDHEGNIWISSLKDGVFKFNPSLNQGVHYDRSNFNDREIMALSRHLRDGIWMTNGNQVFLLQNDDIFSLSFQDEQNNINQILQVEENTILAGALSTPHFLIKGIRPDPSSEKLLYTHKEISPRPFKKLRFSPFSQEILTWNFFTVIRMKPGLFENVRYLELGERVYNVFYNSAGETVVNTKGIFLLRNDSLVPAEYLERFEGQIVTDHLVVGDSIDLYNIEGDSIFIQNGRQILNMTDHWNFSRDLHFKHIEYHDSTLYLGTSRRIYLCKDPARVFRGEHVDLQMLDISFRNIHDMLFQEDHLFIASDFGLTDISGNLLKGNQVSQPVPYFRSVIINDQEYHAATDAVVLTGRSKILITLGSINLTSSPTIYSYMLEGLDKEWQTGMSNNVIYESLSRGEYVFKLRTGKATSGWSDPIHYRIRIQATLWEQPLFYAFISLLLASVIIIAIIWRKNAEIKRTEIEHQLVLLEQRALQSMMNPHFIFNSLGSIQNYLLQSKSSEAVQYLSQFARLIRQNLNSSSSAMIGLKEEVDRLNNYLELENMRMENKFEYIIEVDNSIGSHNTYIPSMVVQPFVENAIWHGISKTEKTGEIRIMFRPNDSRTILILIEDNGKGMRVMDEGQTRSTRHRAMGMAMTRKRLDILGKKYKVVTGITISDIHPGERLPGTRIRMVVPFASGAEKHSL